jgi:hypothetical protein
VTVLLLVVVAVAITAAVVLGLIGQRVRRMRFVLVWLAPLYSAAVFVYVLFRGGPDVCAPYPGPPGYACHPTSFLSSIGWFGVLVVVAVTLVSFAPVIAARTRSRTPAVLGTIALTALIALYVLGLLTWVPADAALLAAAIAGPP